MNTDGSTVTWILCVSALVMLMTPGVGFFYGGLVRKKNFISMVTLSFITLPLVIIQSVDRLFPGIRWRYLWIARKF